MITSDGLDLNFRKATEEHFEDYYALKCQDSHVLWSGFKQKPDHNKFKEWYINQLNHPTRVLYLAYDSGQGEIAGYVTFEIDKGAEIHNSGVSENYHGHGVGTALIAFVIEFVKKNHPGIPAIDGWVSEDNDFSFRMLKKNGFEKVPVTEYRKIEAMNKDVLFTKIIRKL